MGLLPVGLLTRLGWCRAVYISVVWNNPILSILHRCIHNACWIDRTLRCIYPPAVRRSLYYTRELRLSTVLHMGFTGTWLINMSRLNQICTCMLNICAPLWDLWRHNTSSSHHHKCRNLNINLKNGLKLMYNRREVTREETLNHYS